MAKSRATYIPNKNIQSLNVKNGKRVTEIKNKDILDGAYVRKGVKFRNGGNTRGWVNYDKSHLINTETGMIVSKGTDLKNIKPKDIKGFEKLGVGKYANGGATRNKSNEELFTEIVDSLENDHYADRELAFKFVFNTKRWDETINLLNEGKTPKEIATIYDSKYWSMLTKDDKYAKGSTISGFLNKAKNLGSKGIDSVKSGYGKSKDYANKKIYDIKKKNALDVLSELGMRANVSRKEEEKIVSPAYDLVYDKYAKGGGVGNSKVFVATKEGKIEVYSGSDARSAEVKVGDIFLVTEEMKNGIYYLGKLNIKGSFKLSPGLSGKNVSKMNAGKQDEILYLLRKENIDGDSNFFAQFKKHNKYAKGSNVGGQTKEIVEIKGYYIKHIKNSYDDYWYFIYDSTPFEFETKEDAIKSLNDLIKTRKYAKGGAIEDLEVKKLYEDILTFAPDKVTINKIKGTNKYRIRVYEMGFFSTWSDNAEYHTLASELEAEYPKLNIEVESRLGNDYSPAKTSSIIVYSKNKMEQGGNMNDDDEDFEKEFLEERLIELESELRELKENLDYEYDEDENEDEEIDYLTYKIYDLKDAINNWDMLDDDEKEEYKDKYYAKGGNMKVGDKKVYNKLVGRKGNEYYFLDYIFKNYEHFMGAVGTVVTPVHSNYFEYATSRNGLAERYLDAMSEGEWCNTLGLDEDDCTEEEIIDGIENLYRAGKLQPFEECSSKEESQMREIAEFSDSNKYPLFEVIGVGRIFNADQKFDKVYDKSLLALIKNAESKKLANGGNMNNDNPYICTYEIGGL